MKPGGLRLLMTSVIVPTLLMVFVYYGFSTNYTRWVFGEQSFRNQYERGIYRYRLVGREGLLATYRLLRDHQLGAPAEKPIAFTDEQVHRFDPLGDLTFYNAYFVWNTLGMVLTCVLLSLLLRDQTLFTLGEPEVSLWVLLSACVIAVTQFVVTPYDTIAYALLVGCAWASLRTLQRPTVLGLVGSVALLVLATLTRETALLSVALVAAVALSWYGLSRRSFLAVGVAGLAFASTYLALRLWLGTQSAVFDSFSLLGWWREVFSRLGALSLLCVVSLPLLVPGAALRRYGLFLLFSTPYLFVTLAAGVAWEVRLWVPLYLGALMCSRLVASPRAALAP
jgi:hypothetical protein